MPTDYFPTLKELNLFIEYNLGEDTALEIILYNKFPNGVFCKTCKRVRRHHKERKRRSYCCDYCGTHMHPTAGTIFARSTTPLTLWFYAIYLIQSSGGKIPASELQRQLGVTYKCAWRMKDKICWHVALQKTYSYKYSSKVNGRQYQLGLV